jgi:hypothetical protein
MYKVTVSEYLTYDALIVHSTNANNLHPGIITTLSCEDVFNLVPNPQNWTAENVVSSLAQSNGTCQTRSFVFTVAFPKEYNI